MPDPLLVVANIGELVTMAPLAAQQRCTHIHDADLGRLGPQAWIALEDGRVRATGVGALPKEYAAATRLDAHGGLVMPGLVDSHSHALYAGSRADEFWQRANGKTYQDIAAAGGGIRSTMTATRQSSDAELGALLRQRLAPMLARGITTVEVKSGYGLSIPEELRLLRVLRQEQDQSVQTLSLTCLALHAASPEYPTRQAYVDACCKELLPVVAREGLATSVDAFIEAGYFTVAECEPYMRLARGLGLRLRVHADEFSDAGGAAAAAAWQAASADHLQCASDAGIALMAAAGVTATLLPGTSLYTRIPFAAARRFADQGVAVAIATDFNPGSCAIANLPLLATVACMQNQLRPAEAVAAVTFVPACSLGLGAKKGALAPGYDADLALYPVLNLASWLASCGECLPTQVLTAGAVVRG